MEIRQALVQAVCAGMRGGQIAWPGETLSRQDWDELCLLARQQQVLPVLVHSCYASPAFLAQDEAFRREALGSNRMQVARQTMRSASLGALWTQLRQAGFTPVIMKGAACRAVWPVGSVRLSSDEDVLVPHDQFSACVDFLRGQGFACGDVAEDDFEVGLRRGDGLYLELHRSPFAPDDGVTSASFHREGEHLLLTIQSRIALTDAAGETLLLTAPDALAQNFNSRSYDPDTGDLRFDGETLILADTAWFREGTFWAAAWRQDELTYYGEYDCSIMRGNDHWYYSYVSAEEYPIVLK